MTARLRKVPRDRPSNARGGPLQRLPSVQFRVTMTDMETATTRQYQMRARAAATVETGERILDAAVEAFWERPSDQLSMDEVAERAGVSVRTVIRRFGTKEGLFAAGVARELQRTRDARGDVPAGDVAAAVAILVAHYEDTGDRVLKLLTEVERVPGLQGIVEGGRALHQDWCVAVFAPVLAGLTGVARRRRLAQFIAVCDVYMWKLLRRDAGLSRRQTELALIELLNPLLEVY
jgi:AcrR family transcriptional regulator